MSPPKGSIAPALKSENKNFNLIRCILLAKTIHRNPNVLENRSKRKRLFNNTRNDVCAFASMQRESRPCCFDNLSWFEEKFSVKIFIWKKISQHDLKQIYVSQSANPNACHVNMLSFAEDDKDLG